jgi:hypothetical protein
LGHRGVSAGEWRYVAASVAGTSHLARDGICQDASECRLVYLADGSAVLVAVVSDGAGSAARGEVGAYLACAYFHRAIADYFADSQRVADLEREQLADWLRGFADEVGIFAEAEGRESRDYACTLLGAIVEADQAAIFQIGDGAVVVGGDPDPDALDVVFWPQRGEYANQTYFATDGDAPDQAELALIDRAVDEIALLTDGLQGLALTFAARAAHAPFFRPVFAAVRGEPPGESARLTAALAAFLASDRVNQRTDDDKTLVLATRRATG